MSLLCTTGDNGGTIAARLRHDWGPTTYWGLIGVLFLPHCNHSRPLRHHFKPSSPNGGQFAITANSGHGARIPNQPEGIGSTTPRVTI